MVKSLSCVSVVAILLGFTSAFAQSGDFTVCGRVVTAGGQPVAGATIIYANPAMQLSWDISTAEGMFGGPTSAVGLSAQNSNFTLHDDGAIAVDVFDITGKKVGSLTNADIAKGTYAVVPVSCRLAHATYMLRIKTKSQVVYRRLVNTGERRTSADGNWSASPGAPVVLAKKSSFIDTIRVGKTGYTPVYVPIQSYIDWVGNVTLAPIDVEATITSIMSSMTQLQKCGQLCMPMNSTANAATAATNFCGSVIAVGGALSGYTASTSADLFDGYQNATMGGSLKIPLLAAYDAVHGASAVPGATMFPQVLGMGAIQDTFLIQKAYRVTALEIRGSGCNWAFGLGASVVVRDDRWGRAYEASCETPERSQIMARHAVLGLQTTDLSLPTAIAACCKQFAGSGNTVNGVNAGTTAGPDSAARAINLPGYASALSAGVATIQPAFSSWCDGTPMHQNKPLLTDWLKTSNGFNGFVVGDYEGANPLATCMTAGIDLPMSPSAGLGIISTFNTLYGTSAARLDDAVRRILRVKAWMGLLNASPKYLTDRNLTSLIGSAAHRDVARACVRASCVLLKNSGATLPLPVSANVAIWGTGGDNIGIQCGGWTISWQGSSGTPTAGTSIKTGILAIGAGTISYIASPTDAGTSDYVVAVLSENPYAEQTLTDISLSGTEATASNSSVITQIAAAHAAGKKVVCILMAGRPLDISAVLPNCDAFIWACLPGTEGMGIAELLYAANFYKFTGKLPVTWPNSLADEPINDGDGKTGLFPYGFGLTD
jgi:beta-glucosidase